MICAEHQTDAERPGYIEWHARAAQWTRGGSRQRRCTECKRWYFPQEMNVSVEVDEDGIVTMRRGSAVVRGLRPFRGCNAAAVLRAKEVDAKKGGQE